MHIRSFVKIKRIFIFIREIFRFSSLGMNIIPLNKTFSALLGWWQYKRIINWTYLNFDLPESFKWHDRVPNAGLSERWRLYFDVCPFEQWKSRQRSFFYPLCRPDLGTGNKNALHAYIICMRFWIRLKQSRLVWQYAKDFAQLKEVPYH